MFLAIILMVTFIKVHPKEAGFDADTEEI